MISIYWMLHPGAQSPCDMMLHWITTHFEHVCDGFRYRAPFTATWAHRQLHERISRVLLSRDQRQLELTASCCAGNYYLNLFCGMQQLGLYQTETHDAPYMDNTWKMISYIYVGPNQSQVELIAHINKFAFIAFPVSESMLMGLFMVDPRRCRPSYCSNADSVAFGPVRFSGRWSRCIYQMHPLQQLSIIWL